MKTTLVLMIHTIIESVDDNDYELTLESIISELEKNGWNVSIEHEEENL